MHFRDNTLYSLCPCIRERQQEDDCRRVSLTLNIRNSPTKKTALTTNVMSEYKYNHNNNNCIKCFTLHAEIKCNERSGKAK